MRSGPSTIRPDTSLESVVQTLRDGNVTNTLVTDPAGRLIGTVTESDRAPDLNLPQKMGRMLWAPMILMAVMAFPSAAILGIVRATLVAAGDNPDTVALLGQFVPAVMFIGFASVLAAIVFAIARILGELRTGGGVIQEI